MDVRLPDGTIIQNVPDGMSKADLTAKLKKNGYDVSKLEAPTTPQPQTLHKDDTIYDPVSGLPLSSGYGEGATGGTATAEKMLTKAAAVPVAFAAGASRPFSTVARIAPGSFGKDMGNATTGLVKGIGQVADSQYLIPAAELAGEVVGTTPVGGVLARGASFIPGAVTKAAPLIDAIRTGGFSGGSLLSRSAGGAITGAVSAGLVNPSDAITGGVVGGLLPGGIKLAGLTGQAVGRGWNALTTPEQQIMAKQIASLTGEKLETVLAALSQQGPSMVGTQKTVPQILQDPAISQLQRSVINAGDKSILSAEQLQNGQRMAAVNRVSPVYGSVNEAADVAGSAIQNFARPARDAATSKVRSMFESVDPFNETAFNLPIQQMQQAQAKYLGPGTFGMGSKAQSAIDEAQRIGTQELPSIKPLTQKAAGKSQSLEQAVRAAGGIRGTSGELRDLGIKQSGTTGLINNKSGKPIDLLAEEMHRRGFIPDNDPATLADMLRNGAGRNVFANDATDNAFQRAMEHAAGDMPEAERIIKAVPFEHVQNLRSSLNEAWKDASSKGKNKEAAALNEMIKQIDNRVQAVANGKRQQGEYFPNDIIKSWQEALQAHAAKKTRFDTGPQARMFRQGQDGQASIQGAEIPREFFNSRASQIEDVQAFKRLASNNPALFDKLKSYATTNAAMQVDKNGVFTAKKLNDWVNNHSGAIKELFTSQEQATLREIMKDVQRADIGATGGMAKGSNTEQNRQMAERMIGAGLLDNPAVNLLANKIPFGSPLLKSMQNASKTSKAQTIGGLLSDPLLMESELAKALAKDNPAEFMGILTDPSFQKVIYRSSPVLAVGQ